jgi:hypothetical protein
VVEAAPRKGRQRTQLLKFIRNLGVNPFQKGDYQNHDGVGRALEVKIIGAHAVTFWADHSAKEIKVIQVQLTDGV